jgi:hypothetical protein
MIGVVIRVLSCNQMSRLLAASASRKIFYINVAEATLEMRCKCNCRHEVLSQPVTTVFANDAGPPFQFGSRKIVQHTIHVFIEFLVAARRKCARITVQPDLNTKASRIVGELRAKDDNGWSDTSTALNRDTPSPCSHTLCPC